MRLVLGLAILLLAAAVLAYHFYAGSGEEGTVVLEKRIHLLDRPGHFLPSGKKVEKLSKELGGELRSFMLIKPGSSAVFEGIPIHAEAEAEYHLGSEKPGTVEVTLEVRDLEYREKVEFDRPGWRCLRNDLSALVGSTVTMVFEAGDEPVRVGHPVVRSMGRTVALSDYPPILFDDVVNDLELEFDTVEILRSHEGKRLQIAHMRLDEEKRTEADHENPGIWATPDSEFAYTTTLSHGAYLEVAAIHLPPDRTNPRDPGNVKFTITLDGEEIFSLRSDFVNVKREGYFNNPYADLIHRAEIDLDPWAGRTVRLVFRTEHTDRSLPALGAYCWWDLRIKRKQEFPRRRASQDAPNVVIVCVDALRADHLGCYGYERASSPNLDALAQESLVFENAITPCSWTLPATASLLTGLYPNTHGVLESGREYLVEKIWTLAENLSCRGVSTAAFSANPVVCAAINFDQGFERFIEVDEPADGVNEELFSWLEERGPFQFFAYVHYMEPHAPYSAPGEFRQHFDPEYVEQRNFGGTLPGSWRLGKVEREFTDEEYQHLLNLYDAEIYYFDVQFQRLLDKLGALDLKDNTIVIVTSDHGEEFFDHNGLGHGLTLYNEVVQVPLIVYDPRMNKGMRVTSHVSTGALFNTVSDLMNVKPYPGTQLKGLLPLNKIPSRFERVYASTESHIPEDKARWAAMFEGAWKVITDVDGKRNMLFDVENDPGDHRNLYTAEPDRGGRLKEEALDWYKRTAREFPDTYQPSIPELLEEFKRLGYVGK